MRKVAIVGAGQAGLQLAHGLLQKGFSVTLVSDRTPEQFEQGRVLSTQCIFGDGLDTERRLGLNHWEGQGGEVETFSVNVAHPGVPGERLMHFSSPLEFHGHAVDQRVKFAGWLRAFQEAGGTVVMQAATPESVDDLAATHDLTLISAGKGDLGKLFRKNPERTPYDAPQRQCSLVYVRNAAPRKNGQGVSANLIPGAGEIFIIPGLTQDEQGRPLAYDSLLFEAIPGGPMDIFRDVKDPQELTAKLKDYIQQVIPWEAERLKDAELTDAQAWLMGGVKPEVRFPVATLPSGRPVMGLGDTVIVNDPITGQGSGTAAKAADHYLTRILERGDQPFDEAWMTQTFEDFYNDYAQFTCMWTNAMLAPPPEHVLNYFGAAQNVPSLAGLFCNAFNRPRTLFPWLGDPQAAADLVAEHTARAQANA
ncbi:FAD-binding oxidoreductase [Deinococcus cavernae]|uniref:FAD-binding oxidoreductase n=1 Tax=Deinococcus cavernae TaxID=2320857 RepID=A0A418UZX3_9DEIO|nr:styrene monooxygenase/indole monooxygenase family protein [Deinococcus cavernae]RJF69025.1 FAD-binding oxidoreductase [Deinococcus cavernae]